MYGRLGFLTVGLPDKAYVSEAVHSKAPTADGTAV